MNKIPILVLCAFIIAAMPPSCSKQEETVPLTQEEIAYFNGDDFFGGKPVNIRNQFLTSLYEKPEEIDLFELFYSGIGDPESTSEDEQELVISAAGLKQHPDCHLEKISRSNMEAVLAEYMGLTLDGTQKVGLDKFTYLEEYDAYYLFHGDTNYLPGAEFFAGEREGELIFLYYDDGYMGEKVLTLRKKKEGGYLFVSNVKAEGGEAVPLTAEELAYFNGDEFFNGKAVNMRNQFLSSLYQKPEGIDLYELFYSGTGEHEEASDEERKAAVERNGWTEDPYSDCAKVSRADMDAVLVEHMGLSLSEMNGIGLEGFTYLEEYDAYYHFVFDTNYRLKIEFSGGERAGELIFLYYDDDFMGGKKVLTLREKDGKYLFVSNIKTETPE